MSLRQQVAHDLRRARTSSCARLRGTTLLITNRLLPPHRCLRLAWPDASTRPWITSKGAQCLRHTRSAQIAAGCQASALAGGGGRPWRDTLLDGPLAVASGSARRTVRLSRCVIFCPRVPRQRGRRESNHQAPPLAPPLMAPSPPPPWRQSETRCGNWRCLVGGSSLEARARESLAQR